MSRRPTESPTARCDDRRVETPATNPSMPIIAGALTICTPAATVGRCIIPAGFQNIPVAPGVRAWGVASVWSASFHKKDEAGACALRGDPRARTPRNMLSRFTAEGCRCPGRESSHRLLGQLRAVNLDTSVNNLFEQPHTNYPFSEHQSGPFGLKRPRATV